jgi:hypothetical protein
MSSDSEALDLTDAHRELEGEEPQAASGVRERGERVTPALAAEQSEPECEAVPDEREPLTREQRRSRRKRTVRARTISVKRLGLRDVERAFRADPELFLDRPSKRSQCASGPRPCPYVSCRYHLYLDVSRRTGSIKLNFPDLEVWEMAITCALDIADDGGATLEDVGAIMNVTRERIRQLELAALARLAIVRDMKELREFIDDVELPPPAVRR